MNPTRSLTSIAAMARLLVVLVLTISKVTVEGFLQDMFPQQPNHYQPIAQEDMKVRPDLTQLTDNQKNIQLKIQFIVNNSQQHNPSVAVTSSIDDADLDGDKNIEYYYESSYECNDFGPGVASQLGVNGLILKLQNGMTVDDDGRGRPPMPGFNGRHPQLSSGPRQLEIVKYGQYVNLSGVQYVETLDGCWEMCWREKRPGGKLIFGFNIKEEYHRNDAFLPKGRVYLSFPVFTTQSLQDVHKKRDNAESQRKQYLDQRDAELERYEVATNVISKAFHLYKAFAAVEKYKSMPHDDIDSLPASDQFGESDTFPLKDQVVMSKNGIVYFTPECYNHNGVYDPSVREYEILGTAKISIDTKNYSIVDNNKRTT